MTSRGFVIFAEGEEYFQQAYLAALSILASGNKYPVSVITDCTVDNKHHKIFDKIIGIPWHNKDNTLYKTENRWKIYHATPYHETIVLDSDVLVLQDLQYFWEWTKNYDLYFPTTVFTYRKEVVVSDFYRKAFTSNNLPNFYNVVHYFRKCNWTKNFYEWVELVSNNWELFYGKFCKKYYPKQPSMDITTAIVSKILDCDLDVSNKKTQMLNIVHMKYHVQRWKKNPRYRWQDRVGVYFNDNQQLKIGNHRQDTIFHYTENDFPVNQLIKKYEKCLQL